MVGGNACRPGRRRSWSRCSSAAIGNRARRSGSARCSIPRPAESSPRVPLGHGGRCRSGRQRPPRALPAWAETPVVERARVMFRFRERLAASADELARLVTREHGKTLSRVAGLGPARYRDGRVRLRHPQPAHGPVAAEHRPASRLRDGPPPGRRLCGNHAVQLPGDGPALDVSGRDRLR